MAKRFTDTDKWKRPWFSELSNEAKLVWIYLLDECDHRGVWHRNFKRITFDLGFEVNETNLNKWFGDKLKIIDHDKYFIKSFVDFQYSNLNPNNNAHKSIIELLKKLGADEVLMSPSGGAQVTDTATVTVKVKEEREFENKNSAPLQFQNTFNPEHEKFREFLENNKLKHLKWIIPKLISRFENYDSFLDWVEIFNTNKALKDLDAIEFKKYLTTSLKNEIKEAAGA